ncbi:MAG: zeta toxin family protein [Pseudomonadota bacterium]
MSALLKQAETDADGMPLAFVVAGHNGSGKSTLWYDRMSPVLQRPLINADRLITSILPPADSNGHLVPWAAKMRDDDVRWQVLAQEGVAAFTQLVTSKKMSFAFETVFSYWEKQPDGSFKSKIELIENLQQAGYFVVLFFVGLANVDISMARVRQRRERGGHDVDKRKLKDRFPRTQKAIGHAAPLADMTVMFDNSLGIGQAFRVSRVQRKNAVLFDCRDPRYHIPSDLHIAATLWLDQVAGNFPTGPKTLRGKSFTTD